jgi:selenocysteine lyase/cysteine desulfurase
MLPSQRHLFEIPRDVAYVNCAAYAPIPRCVREAGEVGVAEKTHPWTLDPAASLARAEAVRALAGALVGAGADDIAITPATAYGVATAAANLETPRGTRVLMAGGEFPSQSYPWAAKAAASGAVLDIVARPEDGDWTAALLARVAQPGLPPVSVAALTPLHWTDGAVIDLARLVPALRAQGAAIVIDATQAAGVLPIDAAGLGADFIAFPTYKWLLGPYTLGFLYVAPGRQGGAPLERHGGNHAGGGQPFEGAAPPLAAGARRFDMGERYNPVALPMAQAGMALLRRWDGEALRTRMRHVTDLLAAAAEALGWTPVPRALRPPHILGLAPPAGVEVAATVARLAEQRVYVAERGSVMRLGVHACVDEEDVARFAAALRAAS